MTGLEISELQEEADPRLEGMELLKHRLFGLVGGVRNTCLSHAWDKHVFRTFLYSQHGVLGFSFADPDNIPRSHLEHKILVIGIYFHVEREESIT